MDDAFIVGRYAQRLAAGLGYTFSGSRAADGVTGPLWLVPGLVASWLGLDAVVAAKACGLGCMAIACALVLRRLLRRSGGLQIGGIAFVLFACQPTSSSWGVAGLETGAATLATCVAALAVTRRPSPAMRALVCALVTIPWLRPELIVAASVIVVACFVRVGSRALPALWALIASLAALCMFRLVGFGHVLPLAFYAKLGTFGDGIDYVLRACLVLFGGLGLVLCTVAWLRGRSDDRWLCAVCVAHVLAILVAGGDWMPGFRLFAPLLPIYVGLAAVGAQRLLRMRTRIAACSAAFALACACGVPLVDLVTRLPDLRSSGESRERVGAELAEMLRANATRVALVDIGYLGYASGLEIVDLGGITDTEVAHMRGGHLNKHVDTVWLARRQPDAIVLHSRTLPRIDEDGRLVSSTAYPVEQRIARSPWLARQFRAVRTFRYAPGYFYVLFLPRDTDSSPRVM